MSETVATLERERERERERELFFRSRLIYNKINKDRINTHKNRMLK